MKKILPILFILLFLLGFSESFGQCYYQDTSVLYWVKMNKAYGMAISNSGKVAVSSVKAGDTAVKSVVKIWNNVTDFMGGLDNDDSLKLISPQGLVYDNDDNLYVVQTGKTDSNIQVFNSGLALIKTISNSTGALAWNKPRGIAVDDLQNVYVVSADSMNGITHLPIRGTGKLIKISSPLTTATKTLLLSHLYSPKAVAINGGKLYLTENDSNRIDVYNLTTMSKVDSMVTMNPWDLTVKDCRAYCIDHSMNGVNIMRADSLADSTVVDTIINPYSNQGKYAMQLNADRDLFIADNDSGRVLYFSGTIPPGGGGSSGGSGMPGARFCVGSHRLYTAVGPGWWSSQDTNVVQVDSFGNAFAVNQGLTHLYFTHDTVVTTYFAFIDAPLLPLSPIYAKLNGGMIQFDSVTICATHIRGLYNANGGYWSSSVPSVAIIKPSGVVWPKGIGTTIITFGNGNTCNSVSTTYKVTVIPTPNAGIISGISTICNGSATSLTDAVSGGAWSSGDNLVAMVNASGVVTGIGAGETIISYTVNPACSEGIAMVALKVDSMPVAGTISGVDSICKTEITLLTKIGATDGGTWTSSNTTIASVDDAGSVTGINSGSVVITYKVSNSCDTVSATKTLTVRSDPDAGSITGTDSVCVNENINLLNTSASAVGTWSSSHPAIAIVDAGGSVTGIDAGGATISYIVTDACTSDTTTLNINVRALPQAGAIIGPDMVCEGFTVWLGHGTSVGADAWTTEDAAIAAIDAAGTVTGINTGGTVVRYIASNSCGADTAVLAFTVNPAPHAGIIYGPTNGCVGYNYPLSLSGASGTSTWISSDPSIADVDASGMLYASLYGTVTITHISSTTCGSDSTTFTFTVDPDAYSGPIDGIYDPVCMGSGPDWLYANYAVGSGYWYSEDPSIADIDGSGMVTYYSPGTVNIHYQTSTACTTDDSYMTLTVNPLPAAGGITGADSVCYNASINLISFGASSVGTWASGNPAVATVSPTGVVTGATPFPASAAIKYIVTSTVGCGQDSAIHTVYVKRSPIVSPITGPINVCNGSTISLSTVFPGGIWQSSNNSIAPVSATGVVSGAAFLGGTATISYTINTFSCGSTLSTHVVNVLTLPQHGTITGADTVCQNSFDTLRNHSATPGGTWRSRRGYVLFLSAVSGIDTIMFKGTIAGIDTIVYTVSTSCGVDSTTFSVTINSLPLDGDVTGPTDVCVGSTIVLTDVGGTPLGHWSSSDPSTADVDPLTGVVIGNSDGSVVITYSGSTACGSIPDPYTITVNAVANAVIAPSPSDVCMGSSVTLDNTGSFGAGTWSSDNTFIATVDDATGEAGGNNYGTTTISYTTTTPTCGTATATLSFTVHPLPVPGLIFGDDTVCSGATTTLIDVTPSGVWSSLNPAVAIVSTTGVVTGVATTLATTTIRYTVTSATCGTVYTSHDITVKPLPVAGVITGTSTVCSGSVITLTTTIPGTWSTTSPLVTVDATTGAVTGVNVGTATITSTVTNLCGTVYSTFPVNVIDTPVMTAITSLDSLCQGGTFVATAGPASGSWGIHFGYVLPTTATPTTANVYAAAGGIDTLTYTATNSCGTASVWKTIKVLTLPNPGYVTGTDSLCPGSTAYMYNTTGTPGGTWNHTGSHVTISASALVTAVTPGTDTVYYAITGYCGTSIATHRLTVNPLPVAGAITGAAAVCVGSSITLTNPTGTPGGIWSCGTGGTITPGGIFTGTVAGNVTVYYEATTLCGSLFALYTVTVNPLPTVSAISGTTTICAGTSATLTDATISGIWSCSPASVATIDATTGVYNGVATGSAIVSYAVANLCGTTTVTLTVNITTVPVVAAILGTATVCPGGTTTLHDGTPGGVWSVSNTHATISTSGMVTGVTPGTDTVYYTVTNACGAVSVSRLVTVYGVPGADTIAGPSVACIGMAITLTTVVPGGTWTVSNAHATVTGGVVTGITAGVDTIYYAVTNACGSATTSKIVTVHVSVVPMVTAAVSPNDTLCGAAPATYTATPVNGGTAPYIEWRRNGVNIGAGLTLGDSPADGDVISCRMASNATCPTIDTVYSNNITMHVYPNVIPVVTVTVSPGDTIGYIGQPVTFTATLTNCGSSPIYQWYENGTAIAGATSATYSTTAVGNDAFYCIADCNIPCAVAVSNHSNVVTLYTGHVGINTLHPSGVSFSLYPNPNNGNFTLIGKTEGSNEPVTYEIIDMMGRILHSGSTQPMHSIIHEQVVTDSHIAPGQYILRVITGSGAEWIHFTVSK
ncbi:hypothetical protein CJD36_009775 [Flavipsychrobacter stenotrophus]|uniref:BIG2 domain-containing protein n=1 Tax=Flavipsychrobacter stenotrophus TaxID=2077091 RepID=A0A2S7SZM1_9BACT|nr:T9SS type A sorting domain-containing protein [Flavipsychrobacter stenotrophus]PQJ12067.1 hypothetical protein CJD36_009775 [Flavipsychrobacter stenotrophus]